MGSGSVVRPQLQKLKELVDSGELGKLQRVTWIITNWFRSEKYYASGGWRATWAGEGGGVLLNQSPHQLDLLQWICGMPSRVTALCDLGKEHNIEVEDDVVALLHYKNGARGTFLTSTGEAPGTNRLEIAGEMGKVVLENGTLHFTRNVISSRKFSKTSKQPFAMPDVWEIDIPVNGSGGQHVEIMCNFVDAILDGKKLIAHGREGINSVSLGNAMLMSSLTGKSVEMPLDGKAYERRLKKLIRDSTFVKKVSKVAEKVDMNSTFNTSGKK